MENKINQFDSEQVKKQLADKPPKNIDNLYDPFKKEQILNYSTSADVDPFGVKYRHYGVDVRDFLHEYKDDSITFDDVCGMAREKKIVSEICTVDENEDFYDLTNYRPRGVFLFYGVPGVGKTLLANAVLAEVRRQSDGKTPTYILDNARVFDCRAGATERNVNAICKFIKEHEKFVLFIDEIDRIAYDKYHVTYEEDRAIEAILDMLASISLTQGKTAICATCKPYVLDKRAVLIADVMIEFFLPDSKTAYAMLEKKLGGKLAFDVDLRSVANRLVESKCTHRGIKCFLDYTIDLLANEFMKDREQGITQGFDEYLVTNAMIEKAFSEGVISMDEESLIRMSKFRNKLELNCNYGYFTPCVKEISTY